MASRNVARTSRALALGRHGGLSLNSSLLQPHASASASSSAALRAQMRWPARPCAAGVIVEARASFCTVRASLQTRPQCFGQLSSPTHGDGASLRRLFHGAAPRSNKAQGQKHQQKQQRTWSQHQEGKGARQEAVDPDAPIVIYRGGAAWKPGLAVFAALVFLGSGLSIAPLILQGMSFPNFGWKGWKRDEQGKIVPPELLPLPARLAISSFVVMLGAGTAAFFIMVEFRSITRMTIHPASREIALRTALPTPLAFLPLSARRAARLGLKHPLGTVDGREGGARDYRTRVLPLDCVYRFHRQSNAVDFGAASLSKAPAGLRSQLANVMPSSFAAAAVNHGKKFAYTARKTDNLSLSVRPFRFLFTIRAGGGKEVQKFEDAKSKSESKPESKSDSSPAGAASSSSSPRRMRSMFAVGWDRFRLSLLQNTDWGGVPPAEAAELRAAGDPWLRSRCVEAARKRGRAPQTFIPEVIGEGLGPKEPWFRDRQNFDALFPESDK